MININLSQQILQFKDKTYPVSTAKNGFGEVNGSLKTPRGLHEIRAKIGHGMPVNTVFVGRRPNGQTYSPQLALNSPGNDWILTRILWLRGLEWGKNRGGNVDSMRRFIYIHGTPDSVQLGTPGSIGCIRMRNHDVLELFDITPVGTNVLLLED